MSLKLLAATKASTFSTWTPITSATVPWVVSNNINKGNAIDIITPQTFITFQSFSNGTSAFVTLPATLGNYVTTTTTLSTNNIRSNIVGWVSGGNSYPAGTFFFRQTAYPAYSYDGINWFASTSILPGIYNPDSVTLTPTATNEVFVSTDTGTRFTNLYNGQVNNQNVVFATGTFAPSRASAFAINLYSRPNVDPTSYTTDGINWSSFKNYTANLLVSGALVYEELVNGSYVFYYSGLSAATAYGTSGVPSSRSTYCYGDNKILAITPNSSYHTNWVVYKDLGFPTGIVVYTYSNQTDLSTGIQGFYNYPSNRGSFTSWLSTNNNFNASTRAWQLTPVETLTPTHVSSYSYGVSKLPHIVPFDQYDEFGNSYDPSYAQVVYGNNRFVYLLPDTGLIYTFDTTSKIGTDRWIQQATALSAFAIVRNKDLTSTGRTSSYSSWQYLTFLNNYFFTFSTDRLANCVIAKSADGINWNISYSAPSSALFVPGFNVRNTLVPNIYLSPPSIQGAAYGNGKYVIITDKNNSLYSYDGDNWFQGDVLGLGSTNYTIPSYVPLGLTFGNGKFVALATQPSGGALSGRYVFGYYTT